ncbi:hypothetical protein ACFV8T_26280 [Streptomyces sp. NPDC059832]|uniref:hypothetical protein n=1 Tax=Streptomyces sp. NPDC059832 TaxID=3346966 RepID=UPI0036656AC1
MGLQGGGVGDHEELDPLDNLTRKLLARRHGHTTIGTSSDPPRLFPGQPLSSYHSYHLGSRLRRQGTYSRPGRTSALMGPATQLPAAVLTELLGISRDTATAWTHASCIKRHLGLAGRADQLFTEDAITLVHTTARGFSRAVDNLCPQAPVTTFATGNFIVDDKAVQSAVTEILD